MSKYSDYLKERKASDEEWFLSQKAHHESNKYITFNHVIDDDNILLATRNVRSYFNPKSDKWVWYLIVDNDKVVYLKHWQLRLAHTEWNEEQGYIVKLNRNFFKVYTFKKPFEDMCFEEEQTFDSLMEEAKSQNDTLYHVSLG